MIQLVHQFDRPGALAAAAPQSCGGCSCCSCCCCIVTTIAASVITARSLGRPFAARPPSPAASAAPEPAPGADRPGVAAKVFAALLLPASVALGVACVWADAEVAPFVAAGTWAVGLAVLVATRRLRLWTALAILVLGLAAFAAEFVIWLRVVVPQ